MRPLPRRHFLTAAAAAFGATALAAAPPPLATTRHGRLEGFTDAGLFVFRGVPYGADTRFHRFAAAPPPPPWDGVRPALQPGPACPQPGGIAEPMGEDCLVLNVWTPGLRDGAKRPVMVYLHGGEFSSGSGSGPLLDGARLARRGDVVVVTLNHRLSGLAHLYLGALDASFPDAGNAGIGDLVLALQWVRDHAAEFGGDAGCVTVFGQSGGGAKIATLMVLPAARGLFHRAATMSGQQITAASPMAATRRARTVLDALGVKPGELQRLRTLPLETLLAAFRTPDPSLPGRSVYFGPVLDEVHLPRHPFYPDAPPQSASIPMLIGNTREETRYFYAQDTSLQRLSWDELPARLAPAIYVDIDVPTVIAAYRRWYPQYSPTDVFFAASTAGRSWRGAVIEAELRAQQGAPTWAYQLDWRSPLDGGKWGAGHTLDIGLVFGNLGARESLTGTGPEAQRLSTLMQDSFIAFARHGRPGTPALPGWAPYSMARRETMVFELPPTLQHDPRGAERQLFAKVPYVQRGTF